MNCRVGLAQPFIAERYGGASPTLRDFYHKNEQYKSLERFKIGYNDENGFYFTVAWASRPCAWAGRPCYIA